MLLILSRLDFLKSEAQMESVLSRESSFLFNNLVLLASCFAILWGTSVSGDLGKFTGEKISVDAPFFNRINIPIAMFLLLLTGVGPSNRVAEEFVRQSEARVPVADAGGVAVVAGTAGAMGVRQFLRAGFVRVVRVCRW